MKSSFLWSCYIYSSYDLVVILWLENEACQCLCEKEIANYIIVEYINRSKRLKVVAYLYSWCWFRIMIIIIEFIYYSVPLYVSILVSGSSINFYPGDWISGRSFCCTLLAHLFLALSISSVYLVDRFFAFLASERQSMLWNVKFANMNFDRVDQIIHPFLAHSTEEDRFCGFVLMICFFVVKATGLHWEASLLL